MDKTKKHLCWGKYSIIAYLITAVSMVVSITRTSLIGYSNINFAIFGVAVVLFTIIFITYKINSTENLLGTTFACVLMLSSLVAVALTYYTSAYDVTEGTGNTVTVTDTVYKSIECIAITIGVSFAVWIGICLVNYLLNRQENTVLNLMSLLQVSTVIALIFSKRSKLGTLVFMGKPITFIVTFILVVEIAYLFYLKGKYPLSTKKKKIPADKNINKSMQKRASKPALNMNSLNAAFDKVKNFFTKDSFKAILEKIKGFFTKDSMKASFNKTKASLKSLQAKVSSKPKKKIKTPAEKFIQKQRIATVFLSLCILASVAIIILNGETGLPILLYLGVTLFWLMTPHKRNRNITTLLIVFPLIALAGLFLYGKVIEQFVDIHFLSKIWERFSIRVLQEPGTQINKALDSLKMGGLFGSINYSHISAGLSDFVFDTVLRYTGVLFYIPILALFLPFVVLYTTKTTSQRPTFTRTISSLSFYILVTMVVYNALMCVSIMPILGVQMPFLGTSYMSAFLSGALLGAITYPSEFVESLKKKRQEALEYEEF